MTAARTNEDDGGRGQTRQAQARTSVAAAGKPQPPPHHPPNTSRNTRATSIDVRADFARLQGGGAYTLGARDQEGQPNRVRVGWWTSGVAAGTAVLGESDYTLLQFTRYSIHIFF